MMELSRVGSWLQVGANIGIVVGLVLVAIQISQQEEIAGTDVQSELYASTIDYYKALIGEDPAASVARAIYEPEALTNRDKVVLDALYSAEFAKAMRREALMEPGEELSPGTARRWLGDVLTNRYAVAWWKTSEPRWVFAPVHRKAIEAALRERSETPIRKKALLDSIDSLL
jgi:hypothetical protein